MKRFVLGTNRTTAEQDATFYRILRSRWPHLGWWHQMSETWLITDVSEELTTGDLRDAAMEAFPGISIMVIEANGPYKWAGFGPATPPNNIFEWMNDSWDGEH